MPPKKSGGWGRGRGSNNTSIDITQQGGWGTLLPTPMGGLPLSMGGGMPMFGQQSQGPLNGFMGAANPHPMFSTMLGAPAGNVDVTMTAAQMQQFQAQIQLGMQAQMAEAAKQKEAADAQAATAQQGLITSAVQAAVGLFLVVLAALSVATPRSHKPPAPRTPARPPGPVAPELNAKRAHLKGGRRHSRAAR